MRRKKIAMTAGVIALLMMAGCSSNRVSYHQQTKQVAQGTEQTVEPKQTEAPVLQEQTEVAVSKEQIRSIEVTTNGTAAYAISYEPSKEKDSYLYWEIGVPYGKDAIVDTEAMYQLYAQIAQVVSTKAGKVVKKETGIGGSNTSITVTYTDKKDKAEAEYTTTLLVGNKEGDAYYCARKGAETDVLLIDAMTIEGILGRAPFDLILKVPYVLNLSTVSRVELVSGKDTHTMEATDGVYRIDGKEVEKKDYCDRYGELLSPMIAKELSENEKAKVGTDCILKIAYTRNLEGARNYEVEFYSYDNSYDAISVNGETHFLVEKQEVENLIAVLKA